MDKPLTPAWTTLKPHKEQSRFFYSPARFKVLPAGRRSGKTEISKRFLVLRALNPWDKNLPRPCRPDVVDPKYFAAAPTWQQAKRIYWSHLLKLIPEWAFEPDRRRGVSNSELRIKLKSGAEIYVLGLDKPERIEGSPWDGGILDEYGNMHERVFGMHVRPALADREGWLFSIGVPEGRNHYYDMYQEAAVRGSEDRAAGRIPVWDAFHWTSESVLPPEEIEAAKKDLDPLTYSQEYLGSFVSFHGLAYYPFSRMTHVAELDYNPNGDIAICFDFNVAPGVAVICQEGLLPGQFENIIDENGEIKSVQVQGTKILAEVYIPKNSNTPMVARRVMKDWKHHKGKIFIYGDATGGAGGTTAVDGSDWDLIRRVFRENDSWSNRTFYRIPNVNPRERARVNAVNSRLKSSTGIIRMMIDPMKCHYTIKDFEGTRLVEGGSGEIDKRYDERLSHLCFARGTKVETDKGVVDIFDLPNNGKIKTFNNNFVDFSRNFEYNIMDTIELFFGDVKIESTLDHQFLTINGWKDAKYLNNFYCVDSNFYNYLERNVGCVLIELLTRIRKNLMGKFTNYGKMIDILLENQKDYIELFGNIILEKYQEDLRFIISTKTYTTIISQIYKFLLYQNMLNYICLVNQDKKLVEEQLKMQLKMPLNGIEVKKVVNGIENMQKEWNLENLKLNVFAKNVVRNIFQEEITIKNIVQKIARELLALKVELMILLCSVRDAANNLTQINIAKDIIVQKNALKPMVGKIKEDQLVVCPTIDSVGCFCLENNVVVANSDALGYYINYEFPITGEKSYSKELLW